MRGMKRPQPAGFTFFELLVLIAIIGFLLGLLLPAVQRVRGASSRTVCLSKLRQIAIACHNHQDQQASFPPGYGWVGTPKLDGASYGNTFFHLLPYIEQSVIYESAHLTGKAGKGNEDYYAWPNSRGRTWDLLDMAPTRQVKLYECPSDPSLPRGAPQGGWAYASYAANGQVFANVADDGSVFTYDETIVGIGTNMAPSANSDTMSYPKAGCTFGDGGAQTIVFADKYARCGPGGGDAGLPGGNYWGHPWDGSYDAPFFAYAGSRTRTADEGAGHYVMRPDYVNAGQVHAVPQAVKFQTQPNPWRVRCNPFLASTGHTGGINVCLADGSSRVVSKDVSPTTWWAALTPNGHDILGNDW